jgi:hypothetical protein
VQDKCFIVKRLPGARLQIEDFHDEKGRFVIEYIHSMQDYRNANGHIDVELDDIIGIYDGQSSEYAIRFEVFKRIEQYGVYHD